MLPLVDLHSHLLPGLDDGPRTEEEALTLCRIASADGIQIALATPHQSERWGSVTPARICQATRRLNELLQSAAIPLTVLPGAEVMFHPEIEASWRNGDLLSVADRRQYLLLEMPEAIFPLSAEVIASFQEMGVGLILAHAERYPDLLYDSERVEELIQAGCLIQVSTGSITAPRSRRDQQALKTWFRRGIVHFMGSDAHSAIRRPPKMADAYRRIVRWTGSKVADQVFTTNGIAVTHGLPLQIVPPSPRRLRKFFLSWR